MEVLLIDHETDYDPASVHGPFDTIREAQAYARAWRETHDVPGHENDEPTAEENEAWTNAGWYFGIFEPRRENFA